MVAVVALVVEAVREWRAETRRQQARMYADRRPAPNLIAEQVDRQAAEARLTYFARTAPHDEIRDRARALESFELNRAAARVVAELDADEVADARRRHPTGPGEAS